MLRRKNNPNVRTLRVLDHMVAGTFALHAPFTATPFPGLLASGIDAVHGIAAHAFPSL
jgi:hypothetical protein